MKFIVKKIDKNDPKKISEEEIDSPNEQTLSSMYDTLGYNIEIIQRIGAPKNNIDNINQAPLATFNNNIPFMPQIPGQPQSNPTAPKVKEIQFENGGVKFKILQNGEVFKKDWIQVVDIEEYKLVKLTDVEQVVKLPHLTIDNINCRLEKLDWVKVPTNNEPKKDK